MPVKRILFGVIVVFVAVFIFQNTQVVEIRMFFWKVSASRSLMLAVTFLLGAIAGFLMTLVWKKPASGNSR